MKALRVLGLLVAVCLPGLVWGQKSKEVPGNIRYLRAPWELVANLTGDLNKDGKADKVKVYINSVGLIGGSPQQEEYAIFVLLRGEKGYWLADSIRSTMEYLNLPGIDYWFKVKKGCFFISAEWMGPTAIDTITYQFRYQQGKMRLIGYESREDIHKSDGGHFIDQINFSNGKTSQTHEGKTDYYVAKIAKPLPGFKELTTYKFPSWDGVPWPGSVTACKASLKKK